MRKLQNSIDKSVKDAHDLTNLFKNQNIEIPQTQKNLNTVIHTDKIAVLVFSCNRPHAIKNHLDQLISVRKASVNKEKFPIIVSQDCGDKSTAETIDKYSHDLYDFLKVFNLNFAKKVIIKTQNYLLLRKSQNSDLLSFFFLRASL